MIDLGDYSFLYSKGICSFAKTNYKIEKTEEIGKPKHIAQLAGALSDLVKSGKFNIQLFNHL